VDVATAVAHEVRLILALDCRIVGTVAAVRTRLVEVTDEGVLAPGTGPHHTAATPDILDVPVGARPGS
jgi:hypothetical protein